MTQTFVKAATKTRSEFLSRLRSGQSDAYEQLVRQYGPRLLAVARRMHSSEEDAADAVQNAYLSAVRSLDTFQEQCHLGTWLHRIVVNCCLMQRRAKSRRPCVSLEELLPKFAVDGHHAEPVLDWTPDAPTLLMREEVRAEVRRCVDELPPDYRTIILLRDVEQLDTDETAAILGVSRAVVKTRLHRARQALRELISKNALKSTCTKGEDFHRE